MLVTLRRYNFHAVYWLHVGDKLKSFFLYFNVFFRLKSLTHLEFIFMDSVCFVNAPNIYLAVYFE